MASFEHFRGQRKPARYTCPKTNVTFPLIYKVMIPHAEIGDDGQPTFTGEFDAYYQLTEIPCYENSTLRGFPPSSATTLSTLQAEEEFHLEVLHFANKETAQGFRQACFHLGMELDQVSWMEDIQGAFVLLTRNENAKKNGHIIYRSSKDEYISMLMQFLPCEYVAAFNSKSELVTIPETEETHE